MALSDFEDEKQANELLSVEDKLFLDSMCNYFEREITNFKSATTYGGAKGVADRIGESLEKLDDLVGGSQDTAVIAAEVDKL